MIAIRFKAIVFFPFILFINARKYCNLGKAIPTKFQSHIGLSQLEKPESFSVIEPYPSDHKSGIYSQVVPMIFAAAIFAAVEPAVADSAQYGILAGRTASMIHPITNFALFGTSIYSAYLGLRWRSLRGISEELKSLSSQLPALKATTAKFPLNEQMKSIEKELNQLQSAQDVDVSKTVILKEDLEKLRGVLFLDNQYNELNLKRKDLLSQNLKDKHHLTGSVLLGSGVTVSILGAFNTYMRAGKLFPGPHLYAGMGITILWAGK
jgi:hypothetical protein